MQVKQPLVSTPAWVMSTAAFPNVLLAAPTNLIDGFLKHLLTEPSGTRQL